MNRYSIALGKKPVNIEEALLKKKVDQVYEVVYTLKKEQHTFSLDLGDFFKFIFKKEYELKKEEIMLAKTVYVVDNFAIWLQKDIVVKEFKDKYGGFKFWATKPPEQKEKWGDRGGQVGIGTTGMI